VASGWVLHIALGFYAPSSSSFGVSFVWGRTGICCDLCVWCIVLSVCHLESAWFRVF